MRKMLTLVTAILVTLMFAGSVAHALPYTGTFVLQVGTLDPFVVPGNGDGVSTPAQASLGAANFITTVVVALTPAAFPLVQLELTGPAGLAAGTFNAGGGSAGGFGGDAPLIGNALLGLFGPPPFAFLTVPLAAFGVDGGVVMTSNPALGVAITVFGNGWTTGQQKVIGTTGPFLGVTLATATGADLRSAGGGGQLVLVTAALAKTNVGGSENLPLVGVLTLNYDVIPEPGTLMLLGTGVAGLAMLGRRRERR